MQKHYHSTQYSHRNTLVPKAFDWVAALTTQRILRCLAERALLNVETPEATGAHIALTQYVATHNPHQHNTPCTHSGRVRGHGAGNTQTYQQHELHQHTLSIVRF